MAIKQLSDGNPDGTVLGQGTNDLIGFYGNATPVARRANANQGAITDSTGGAASLTFAAIAAGGAYAQADLVAIKNALAQIALSLNEWRTVLLNLNLIKGAA